MFVYLECASKGFGWAPIENFSLGSRLVVCMKFLFVYVNPKYKFFGYDMSPRHPLGSKRVLDW